MRKWDNMKTTITRTITETNYTVLTVNLTDSKLYESTAVIAGTPSIDAILRHEKKSDTDIIKTVSVKDLSTVEHVYEVDIKDFIEHAAPVSRRTSADSITKTVTTTTCEIMKVDVTTMSVNTVITDIIGAITDAGALLKTLQKEDTDTQKTVNVNITGTKEQLYELSLSAFLSIADKVK